MIMTFEQHLSNIQNVLKAIHTLYPDKTLKELKEPQQKELDKNKS